jgi:hypothetical protein
MEPKHVGQPYLFAADFDAPDARDFGQVVSWLASAAPSAPRRIWS